MYEELVKRLRDAAKMSEALAVLLPHSEGNVTAKLYNEAADAIEKLSKEQARWQEEAKDWYLAYMDLLPTRWIPVTERLPDQNQENMYICLIVGGEYDQLSWYELCDFAEGQFWIQDDLCKSHVTHWMPLPEPPKGE